MIKSGEINTLVKAFLRTDDAELKKFVDLDFTDKATVEFYKKNLDKYAEYYLSKEEYREKMRKIQKKYEEENPNLTPTIENPENSEDQDILIAIQSKGGLRVSKEEFE